MKTASLLFASLSFVASLATFVVFASTASAVQSGDPAFRERFEKTVGKKPDAVAAVKAESTEASEWIAILTERLRETPDPAQQTLLDALAEAWTDAQRTDFPARFSTYLAGLDAPAHKLRAELRTRLDQAFLDLDTNREKRDARVFAQCASELELLAAAFSQEGDAYFSSQAAFALGECFDETLRGAQADLGKAAKAFAECVTEREKSGARDARLETAQKRATALAKRGAGGPPKADQPLGPPSATGETIKVPLTFEALSSIDQFARPNYCADEVYPIWRALGLTTNGSQANFDTLPEAPPVWRVGASDARFDTDGDGKGDGATDVKVPLTGNITPVRLTIGKGENARPWAFFAATGNATDRYNGVPMNLQIEDQSMQIYTLAAASVVGTVGGTPFRIIDESMDGLYGSDPQTFTHVGVSRDHYQPELDSIVVGASKRARPFSEYTEIGGKWYRVPLECTGTSIDLTPVSVATGTLKLEFKGGPMPSFLIVRGTNELKHAYFDLVEGGSKGVAVPSGRYQLYFGMISKGKKREVTKVAILPTRAGGTNYDVEVGGTTVVQLGAPFDIEFKHQNVEGIVTITGQSVVVTGSQSERYERPWNCIVVPEVQWRKKGTKKAQKGERMPHLMDQDALVKAGWEAGWFPLDLTLDLKNEKEVELQLVEKKHEFFGKIESSWNQ